MSKVIAVIDKPKNCEQCPCFSIGHFYDVCRLAQQTKSFKEKGIPDWCPLREVPKKKNSMNLNSIMEKCKDRDSIMDSVLKQFIVDGYNACIDEILKGAEENG